VVGEPLEEIESAHRGGEHLDRVHALCELQELGRVGGRPGGGRRELDCPDRCHDDVELHMDAQLFASSGRFGGVVSPSRSGIRAASYAPQCPAILPSSRISNASKPGIQTSVPVAASPMNSPVCFRWIRIACKSTLPLLAGGTSSTAVVSKPPAACLNRFLTPSLPGGSPSGAK